MEHIPDHIWQLIARKLSGEATPAELHELDELLRQYPDAGYPKEIFHDLWQTDPTHDRQYAENRYKELVQQIKKMGIDEGRFTEGEHYINKEPGTSKSFYKRNRVLAVCSLAVIVVITAVYFIGSNGATEELAETSVKNQVSTKNGSKTSLVLPDGTKVWLNADSRLDYDKSYGNTIREVSLVGEAYFDVVKNPARPFVIHTNKMDIKVLGTAFNVKCYPGEKTTETSLIRGSIEVTLKDRQEKIMLKPNEKLVLNNDDIAAGNKKSAEPAVAQNNTDEKPIISVGHLTFLPVDSTVVETAWVQNRLVFSSESFEEVALQMERWYNVKIEFADEPLKKERLTGNFEKETVIEAFNALQLTTPFSYSTKGDKIILKKEYK